jgi:hypothetical protein
MIGTDEFRHLTRAQLAAKYAEARDAVVASGRFKTAEEFDAHVERVNAGQATGIRLARYHLQTALGQMAQSLVVTPPSEETLAWGGFLGGEIYHDKTAAEAFCRRFVGAA